MKSMDWSSRKSIYVILIIVLVALLPVLVQKGLANA
jgi:regulatory protein YycI of two-component signal transduction system YycFG